MLNILIYYLLIYETCAGSSNKRKAEETESNIPTKGARQTLEDESGRDISASFISLLDPHIDEFLNFVEETNNEENRKALEETKESEEHEILNRESVNISNPPSDVVKPLEFSEVEELLDMTLDELAQSLEENLTPPTTPAETNFEPPLMEEIVLKETIINEEQTVILPLTFTGNLDEQLVILPLTFTGSADEQVIILQGTFAEDIQDQVVSLQETFKGNLNETVVQIPLVSSEHIDELEASDFVSETVIPQEDDVYISEELLPSEETYDEHELVFKNILETSKSLDPNTLSPMYSIHENFDKQAVNDILILSEEPFLGKLTGLEDINEEIINEILSSSNEPFHSELFKNQFENDQPTEPLDLRRSTTYTDFDVEPSLITSTPEQTQLEEENTYDSDVTSDSLTLSVVLHSNIDNLSTEPILFEEESIDLPTFAELTNVPMPSPTSETFIETEYSEEAEPLAESDTNIEISSPSQSSTGEPLIETLQPKESKPSEENIYFIETIEPGPSTSSNIISPDIEEIYREMVQSIKDILYKSFKGWYIERLDVIKKMINNIKISKHSISPAINKFKETFDDKLINLCDKMGLRGKKLLGYELFEYESFDSISTTILKNKDINRFLLEFKFKYKNQIFSMLCNEFVQLFNYFPVFPELMTLGSLIDQGKDDLLLIYIRLIHLILMENKGRIEEMRNIVLFLIKKSFAIPKNRSKKINIGLKVQLNTKKTFRFKSACNKNHSNLSFLMWEFEPSKHRSMKYYGKKPGEFIYNLTENTLEHFRVACYSVIFQQIMFTEYHNISYNKYKELLDSLIDNSDCVFCLFEKYLDLLKVDLRKVEIKTNK